MRMYIPHQRVACLKNNTEDGNFGDIPRIYCSIPNSIKSHLNIILFLGHITAISMMWSKYPAVWIPDLLHPHPIRHQWRAVVFCAYAAVLTFQTIHYLISNTFPTLVAQILKLVRWPVVYFTIHTSTHNSFQLCQLCTDCNIYAVLKKAANWLLRSSQVKRICLHTTKNARIKFGNQSNSSLYWSCTCI